MPLHASAEDAFVYAEWLRIKHRTRAPDMKFGEWVLRTYYADEDEACPPSTAGRMRTALTTDDAYHAFVQCLMSGELSTVPLSWVHRYELYGPAVDIIAAYRRVQSLLREHAGIGTIQPFSAWLLQTFYDAQVLELLAKPQVLAMCQASSISQLTRALMTCLVEGHLPAAPLKLEAWAPQTPH